MRVIFLNRFFYPDHSATSQMLTDLAFGLAQSGHEVCVITSRQLYENPSVRLAAQDDVAGVTIHRVWTTRFGRSGLVGRAVDYLTFYLAAAIHILRHVRRGDVVVAKTDPPMLSVIVTPLCAVKRARSINWLQDLFPEVAEVLTDDPRRSLRIGFRVLEHLRTWSLRRASLNVAIGERMAERLLQLGVAPDRMAVIPNWADGALVRPVARQANALRRAWGLNESFVVGYAGNFGRAHDYETVRTALTDPQPAPSDKKADDALASGPANPHVVWLFVGGGKNYDALQDHVRSHTISHVLFQPYQSRDQLAASLSVPDVHLVSLYPGLEGLIVPSKIYGIMAAGRPTIFVGDPDGEIATLLRRHDMGLVVQRGDAAGLNAAVRSLAADPVRCAAMGARARMVFEQSYDRPWALRSWAAVLDRIGGAGATVGRGLQTDATPTLIAGGAGPK